jgi:hypothetical protein
MKVIRWASVATSSNQCFLGHYTMQLRFGTAMSFDNRLIAAHCIGGACSLGEAHSQNERLWNGCLWRTFAKTSRSACVDSGSGSPAGGMTRTENKSDRYSQDLRTARGATVVMVLPMVGFSRRGDQRKSARRCYRTDDCADRCGDTKS